MKHIQLVDPAWKDEIEESKSFQCVTFTPHGWTILEALTFFFPFALKASGFWVWRLSSERQLTFHVIHNNGTLAPVLGFDPG